MGTFRSDPDDSDFDEISDEVFEFELSEIPDLLKERVSSTYEEGFVEHLERQIDERLAELSDEELHSLDVPYDDEDIYADAESWGDDSDGTTTTSEQDDYEKI
jgi:hypothetical protein